jgi:hypothetical protein
MSKNLKEALQFTVPIQLDKFQWLAMLDILEFAYLTYANIAEQTKDDTETKTSEHALIMRRTAKNLLEMVQDSAVNALYSSDTSH